MEIIYKEKSEEAKNCESKKKKKKKKKQVVLYHSSPSCTCCRNVLAAPAKIKLNMAIQIQLYVVSRRNILNSSPNDGRPADSRHTP